MQTFVSVVILALVASSCLKRRQVTDKPPASAENCPLKTKPYKTSTGSIVCIKENDKPVITQTPTPPNPHERCADLQVLHIDGYCALRSDIVCPEGTEKRVVRNAEDCLPIEEPAEEESEQEEEDETEEITEEQPILAGISKKTRLNAIKVNAVCIGSNKCFHPNAKELVCQAHCVESAIAPGYTGRKNVEFVKVDSKGKIKKSDNGLCELNSGATLNETEKNNIECYLSKGGWLFGWGSEKINNDRKCSADDNKCPFLYLTINTVGKKYICVESLNTDSDPTQSPNQDYLAIHNKKCDTIKNDNPKLQIEFSL